MWKTKYLTAATGEEVVGWDLDSSVRSTMQRRWLIPEIRAGRATWDDYSMLCAQDEPVEGAVALMRMFRSFGLLNIAISACSDPALELTVGWAVKHSVPLDDFLLRPPGETVSREDHKVDGIRRLQVAGLVVKLYVEDNPECAARIRDQTGVPVLGVNPFDPGTMLVGRASLSDALAHSGGYGPGSCGTRCADGAFRWLRSLGQ